MSGNHANIERWRREQRLALTQSKRPELVRQARPGTPVLFMSGYTDDAVVRHGVQLIGVANIAASVPLHASQMFSTNVRTLLTHLSGENGALTVNAADEITGPMLLLDKGEPVTPPAKK